MYKPLRKLGSEANVSEQSHSRLRWNDVLGAEAVASSGQPGDSKLGTHALYGGLDDRVDVLREVRALAIGPLGQPGHEVEVGRWIKLDGVA